MREFRLLGPMEVHVDGREVQPAPKRRALLASLLVNAGHVVTADRLIRHLWGDGAGPVDARTALHIHVTRLRKELTGIRTVPQGYLIDLDSDELDLLRFRHAGRLALAARHAGDVLGEVGWLEVALACWRGNALQDVPSDELRTEVGPVLDEQRLQAAERYYELSLRLGRHDRVLPGLRALTRSHPGGERLWGLLMLALHRSDRHADALAAFWEVKTWLNDTLGIAPGKRLSELYRAILTGDEDALAS